MSSSGSFDSLSCSSPSGNKNFSSTDDTSKCISMDSLDLISPNDGLNNDNTEKPENKGSDFLQADSDITDIMKIENDSVTMDSDPVKSGENPHDEDGSTDEVKCSTGSRVWEVSALEDSKSKKLNARKRLREKSDDDRGDDDNNGVDDLGGGVPEDDRATGISDNVDEAVEGGGNEDDEERRRAMLNMLLSSSSSSSTSEFDSEYDDDVEEMMLNGDFFLSRFLDSNGREAGKLCEAKKNVAPKDEPCNFHRKILKMNRQREMGFPHKRFNGVVAYQGAVISDVDIVQKFGLLHRYEKHTGCVNSLHFNESGNLIVSGSDDMMVVIYDWIKQKVRLSFISHHKENIFQTKFMPHSQDSHVLTCARDGQVRVAQISTTGSCRSRKKLAFHNGAVHKLALINDSAHEFYSCGEDGVTFKIDLRQQKPPISFLTKKNGSKVALYSVHANPAKSYEVCVVGRDPYVRIYDVRNIKNAKNARCLKKFCPDNLKAGYDHVTAAVYNHDGTEIIASYNDDDIYLFDSSFSDGASHINQYEGHRNSATVKGVNFYGSKSEYVVSGSDCGNVFVWDKKTSNLVNVFHADETGVVNVIENHPSLPLIATSGLDSDVKLWFPDRHPASDLEKFNLEKKNGRSKPKMRMSSELDDNSLLWFLMRTFNRAAGEAESGSDTSEDFAMDAIYDENEEEDDEGTGRGNVQCASS